MSSFCNNNQIIVMIPLQCREKKEWDEKEEDREGKEDM